jgi:SAM-dependent methyltransferase
MGVFDGDQYIELRKNRFNAIINHFDKDWFKDKKVLELGCGYGDLGNMFQDLGAKVTITDAREEHIKVAEERYPTLQKVVCDLNKEWPFEKDFDFILNTGILYHLKETEFFMKNCFSSCTNMFLEAIVSDSNDPYFKTQFSENGPDQAFTNIGSALSEAFIERLIKDNGFKFEKKIEKSLNYGRHLFDWEPTNSEHRYCYIDGVWHWLRRVWICFHE